MRERDASAIELHQISGETLSALVGAVYSGSLEARTSFFPRTFSHVPNTPTGSPPLRFSAPCSRPCRRCRRRPRQVSWENVAPLLFGATQLGLRQQAETCCAFLRSSLSPESVVATASLAAEVGDETLLQTALEFLSTRLSQVRNPQPHVPPHFPGGLRESSARRGGSGKRAVAGRLSFSPVMISLLLRLSPFRCCRWTGRP